MRFNAVLSTLHIILLSSPSSATEETQFEQRCSDLTNSFNAVNTDVLLAEYVTQGTNITFPEPVAKGCLKFAISLADMCRLRLNVTTSSTSSVIIEVFMPTHWESKGGRFLMTGNGALGGCIQYNDMTYGTSLGFAAVGHNNGHAGDTGLPFLNRPEVVKDYAWRALHTAGKIGKSAVNHFYSSLINKSYYIGCSSGGRQGLKAAQEFPEEYDGIVSAAPAVNFHGIVAAGSNMFKITGPPGSATHLNQDQWNAVHQMVVDQCDGIDGVLDNVLEDPMKCQPRPEELLCGPGQTWTSNQCLTAAQVLTVRKIYSPVYGNNGRLLVPRLNPITKEFVGYLLMYGGVPGYIGEEWYRYALYNDPTWTIQNDFNWDVVDHDFQQDLFGVGTKKTDLTDAKNNNTRILMYHGLTDCLITSENSYDYYEGVSRDMGLPSSQLDEFYRFFPVAGLDHCTSGDGAWFVGGSNQYTSAGALDIDPADSVLMTMVKWVEQGIAPDTLMGRKLVGGVVTGEKAHCRHPFKTTYKGVGDPNLASSWECRTA
ncbi:Tannase and feruloyl esterase [Orbilia oligospora]|uniref:Carboxylic ester hydrolase n=1 Tax=Orbilia oligospora TaxID=2813651 RepID=A0A7C8U8V5_ORBOL|nr:Tannase and feruloyl esterase [Orbilia oligospora]KAF3188902.1 Tannase and feruloyl esterase [Orbilia oligospora]KAF3238024.1 Tannase and feruloyl esterase [Orbilia oligospora]KAF3267326.1 Tannase and feruloyl esterase [Orbilia oligospora]TGJ69221.1 Tannase and feruloyl esterase [Orbilia oligospora]